MKILMEHAMNQITFIMLMASFSGFAQLKVHPLFDDHMVIQRNQEVRVWGWNGKSSLVKVELQDKIYETRTNEFGEWELWLGPNPAGGPYEIKIYDIENSITIKDIYFGDVWLCSGQSNMEFQLYESENGHEEALNADYPQIRHFKIDRLNSREPNSSLPHGNWVKCDPDTAGGFTAVGYYFAKDLNRDLHVPIGLINSTWGGSSIESWMSKEASSIQNMQSYFDSLDILDKTLELELNSKIGKALIDESKDESFINNLFKECFDDGHWKIQEVPQTWEKAGYVGLNGVVYYRKEFKIDFDPFLTSILSLGKIDNSDITWLNGVEIGRNNYYKYNPRAYLVPSSLLKKGKNILLVRVHDEMYSGGFRGLKQEMYLKHGERNVPLHGTWKFAVSDMQVEGNLTTTATPTLLYNAMIHPLTKYPIKGVLWYQGESNAHSHESSLKYGDQLKAMITDWRQKWELPDLPFFIVQLPNYETPTSKNGKGDFWPVLRKSQAEAASLENTELAITIDLGDPDDIHPKNKKDVGDRLAMLAKSSVYHIEGVPKNLKYKSHYFENGKILLSLEGIGGRLIARDNYGVTKGFELVDRRGKVVYAKAEITDTNEIWISSENILEETILRYAWYDNPIEANVFNDYGLPLTPFEIILSNEK